MSEIATPQPEKDLTRVDTMGGSKDSRTASADRGVVSNRSSYAHTPGPWRLDDAIHAHVLTGDGYHVIDADGGMAAFGGFSLSGFMSDVDAQLIASAPALIAERDAMRDQIAQLRDVCVALDGFQRFYRENAYSDMPGNNYYSECLMRIVTMAREALLSSSPATGEGR